MVFSILTTCGSKGPEYEGMTGECEAFEATLDLEGVGDGEGLFCRMFRESRTDVLLLTESRSPG